MSLPILNISDEALRTKDIWAERPDEKYIEELKTYISETGKPYDWWGVTHSAPPKDCKIVYLGEFALPKKFSKRDEDMCPCPCCSMYKPKFKGTGKQKAKIVWFPEEKVIRVLGPDCYSSLNPDGHEEAIRQFEKEKAIQKATRFISQNFHIKHSVIRVIEQNLLPAMSVDKFHKDFHNSIKNTTYRDLYKHINEGELSVYEHTIKIVLDENGNHKEVPDQVKRIVARIEGSGMLRRSPKNFSKSYSEVIQVLESLPTKKEIPDEVPLNTLKHYVKEFTKAINKASNNTETLRDYANFIRPITINSLNRWSQHENSPIKFFISHQKNKIGIGKYYNSQRFITLSPNINETIIDIPKIGTGAALNTVLSNDKQ